MKRVIFAAAILIATSCATNKGQSGKETVSGNTNEKVANTDTLSTPKQRPVYHAAETILTDLIHTKLEVDFDWQRSYMNGTATITAKPHFYPSDSLILDAKGMEIKSVKSELMS
jgi:aminopeptidase N